MPTLQEAVRKLAPKADPRFVAALTDEADAVMIKYGMGDASVAARFLAQNAHETCGFREFTENMNYSAARLPQVWPSRFSNPSVTAKYAKNPQALANNVYANRMGNGPESSGDGYKYRGGGLTHHTGKSEYARVKAATGHDADTIRDPVNAVAMVEAAASYWVDRKVISPARAGDDRTVCIRINGGTIGLEDRIILTRRYLAVFNGQGIPKQRTRQETAKAQGQAAVATGTVAGASGTTGTAVATAPAKPVGATPQAETGGAGAIIAVTLIAAVALGGVAWWLWRKSEAMHALLARERDESLDLKETS